jgi:hypothetical protein
VVFLIIGSNMRLKLLNEPNKAVSAQGVRIKHCEVFQSAQNLVSSLDDENI